MLKRKTLAKIPVAADLETHVSTVEVAGEKMLDLRQFIPSIAEYGRGVTLPMSTRLDVIDALQRVKT